MLRRRHRQADSGNTPIAAQLGPQWYEGGPGSTPTVDSNRVFTISKWGDVFCLDAAKGTVLWQRDLRQDGVKPNRWGFAGSPLVWGDLVILNAGTAGIALDRSTGRIVWSNGTNAAGYASPTRFASGGRESVLIFAAKHLVALEPQSGRELWRQFWETDWDTNNTDPLVHGDEHLHLQLQPRLRAVVPGERQARRSLTPTGSCAIT